MTIIDKINFLNKDCKTNWEIRFHGDYVDINYPDSPVTPDYEDYKSLNIALDEVIKDLLAQKENRKECKHDYKPQRDRKGGEVKFWFCDKCNRKVKSTPSPLEIEEIDSQKIVENMCQNREIYREIDASMLHKINEIISNQKKLYQYIKENKI